ncbi:pirin family protein [Pseudomonas typographi]|uniref:pirin family protein n=1 Tax=Pseudomonas typographi TaxID=2715964 RepID=UPI00168A0A25|nr:pirin family protein [Pseudomonas typographi]MBD1551429.1 pirin family protein [Pseudomonas typographi]
MTSRIVLDEHLGQAASDGAGVRLTRVFGGPGPERFDPFLMLDEFGSENPDDYIAGFPPHPHRGFETVTYMLEGRMRHEDHMGNVGLLASGGVQWMTAAGGVVHSEMPEQEEGTMRGFQLWLNLPASAKLGPASYRDIPPAQLPRVRLENGIEVIVIAGRFQAGGVDQLGAVQRPGTEPHYFDLHLPAGTAVAPKIPDGHRVLLYVYDGSVTLDGHPQPVGAGRLLRLGEHGEVNLSSASGGKLLLIAGRPLNEPIVQYGPFVMNSHEEIEQALSDLRRGQLVR